MSRFLEIRNLLGMTQQEMAEVLGCVQSNVSFLDRGQTITPEVAGKIVSASSAMGVLLTFDHVYGAAALPMKARAKPGEARPHDWPGVLQALASRGWSTVQLSVRVGVRLGTLRALAVGEMVDAPHAVGRALLALHDSGEAAPADKLQRAG